MVEIVPIKGIVYGTFRGIASNLQGKLFEITYGKIINGELKEGTQKFQFNEKYDSPWISMHLIGYWDF